MLKIACIAKHSHPAKLGGIETFQRNLNLVLDKYDFQIYSYITQKEKIFKVSKLIEIDNTKNNFFKKFILKLFGRKRVLKLFLKKWQPNIIIINTPNDLKFLKNFKSKIILVQHFSFEYYMDGTFNKSQVLNLIKDRLDKFIFLSPYDLEKFNNFLQLPKEKVTFIRHISNINLLERKKIKGKKLIIVSRLHKDKRIDYAIEAMKKLKDFSLEIYGTGEEKENLESIIKELKLSNVKIKGKVIEVVEALDKNNIYVMTSESEGYGIANIEAMRRGLPIILRNTFSSARDIVQGNGVLLSSKWDEDEFVKAVYDVYDNYEEYSKKSLELGKRHDIEVIKKEWKKLIEI